MSNKKNIKLFDILIKVLLSKQIRLTLFVCQDDFSVLKITPSFSIKTFLDIKFETARPVE